MMMIIIINKFREHCITLQKLCKFVLFITSDKCGHTVVYPGGALYMQAKRIGLVPQSLSPTRTRKSQHSVYRVLFSLCYVTAEETTSRGKLAICQPASGHVSSWDGGKLELPYSLYNKAHDKSLLVISVEGLFVA
jgi:hypothetical protein